MNRLLTKRFGTLLSAILIFSSVSFSQFADVDFLRSAPADGVKLIQAYVSPYANAFGAGLNGSWYNTAKPHKLGGFDITAAVNIGVVPSSAETFEISSLLLSTSLTGTGTAPTIAGSTSSGPALTYRSGTVPLATFNTPPGTSWNYIPVPTAQIGIGLPLGTELKVRFLPRIPIKESDISLWGVGLLHSIMQYIPGNKLLPVDVSVFAGYTKLTGNQPVNLQPDLSKAQNYSAAYPAGSFNDQNLKASVTALNVSAIASLSIPILTVYGGIGYSKTKTLIELSGNFPTPVLVTPVNGAPYAEYNDSGVKKGSAFPKMDIENFSGLRANAGLRVKFAVITLHADYTRSQYNVFSAGLGISFR